MTSIYLYIGSILIFLWGIAHIIPTHSVVKGFGALSDDNRQIIIMEWVAEGLLLCFLGVLVFAVVISDGGSAPLSILVIRLAAVMALIMAVWTFFTGFKTSIIPIKLCPFVKTCVALLFFIGTI
jgi:hypothetical protein